MTIPVEEFAPLTTDYELDWDAPGACGHDECLERAKNFLKDGEHYEHAFVHLENGYTLSLMRYNKDGRQNYGFEDGLWEAAIGVEASPIMKMLMGVEYTPSRAAEELIGGFTEEGVLPALDNAAVNALITAAASLPQAEQQESIFDGMDALDRPHTEDTE